MNTKLNKLIFLAIVISLGSPYLVGRAHAKKYSQTNCELCGMEMGVQVGLTNVVNSWMTSQTHCGSLLESKPARHG